IVKRLMTTSLLAVSLGACCLVGNLHAMQNNVQVTLQLLMSSLGALQDRTNDLKGRLEDLRDAFGGGSGGGQVVNEAEAARRLVELHGQADVANMRNHGMKREFPGLWPYFKEDLAKGRGASNVQSEVAALMQGPL